MRKILALLAAAALAVGVLAAQAPAGKSAKVVVSKGKAIQIAAVLPLSGGAAALGESARNKGTGRNSGMTGRGSARARPKRAMSRFPQRRNGPAWRARFKRAARGRPLGGSLSCAFAGP